MANNRVTFGSKLGVVLATVGCAVGLGSVWRFPYMLGANGGAAFLLVYILFMIFLGIPVMITEFFIGRHSRSNTVGSFKKMAPGTKWCWIGYNGILAAFLILSYYSVVSGWTLEYVWQTLSGRLYGQPDIDYTADFQDFASNVFRPIFWMGAFIGLTHFVIVSGVEKGIERASKIMMPLLFLILLIMCVRSVTLPNAEAGLLFLFKPDFSKLTSSVVLSALGQAFFSLSLGMGCLITYSSYFGKDTNMQATAWQVTIIKYACRRIGRYHDIPGGIQFRHHPFRWRRTRVYHVTERIWAITAEWLVVLYFLYLASDGGTDFHDLFT